MMIHALVTGKLFRTPEQRASKTGKPFVTGTLRVPDGNSFQFVRLIAFSTAIQDELMRLDDGDAITVQGSLKAEIYEKDGEHRVSLSMVADHVLALRQPPRERKTRASGPQQDAPYRGGAPAFDDVIPFGAR